jgi:serine/threonine-protein kinase
VTKKRRTKGPKKGRRARAAPKASRPRLRTLDAAVALGLLNAVWAAIQWKELLDARSGTPAFCLLGASDACETVLNSAFAVAVERWALLPVAGWGLAWSLVASALPLWTRINAGRGRPSDAPWSATLLTAAAGIGSIPALVLASFSAGALCTNCALTYLMVGAYAAVCARDLEPPVLNRLRRGLPIAGAATVTAFLLLLTPALRTSSTRGGPLAPGVPGDPDLASLLGSLSPADLQELSNALAVYANAEAVPLRPPRSLVGPAFAPVRITEFSDILCGHCAELHVTLTQIRRSFPAGSFAVEPRQFPLDAACNPYAAQLKGKPVRCTAAKTLICAEGEPYAFDLAGALFENQRSLTEAKVYALAKPYVARAKLAACIAAPATQAKLADDIRWAMQSRLKGTPLVLVNGRTGSAFAPFLRAIVLAGGDADRPAFAKLPEPGIPKPGGH